jgi:MFS family permease
MFLVAAWGWLGRRFGIRWLLILGYTLAGASTLAVALAAGIPWLGAALLVAAAFAASLIDGAGNVPFLRAVRPLERPEMTAVFGTFRHTSQIVMPGLFAVLLKAFALPAVFLASGGIMLALAYYARYIPRRLK